MTESPAGRPAPASGSIYDLGYRGYEGPRLGRRAAIGALLTHTLRTAYGLGRSGRSKVMPVGVVLLSIVPSVVFIGALVLFARFAPAAQATDALAELAPIRYETLFPFTAVLVFLFSAAQAPELFGRDQQSGVLPLYFSRAISRWDYAIARLAGLLAALLVVVLAPQVILFAGRVLVGSELIGSLGTELAEVPVTLAVGLIVAGVVGTLSAAAASLTPRRAYATVAIIVLFLVPTAAADALGQLEAGVVGQVAVLLSPPHVLDGVNAVLFGATPENPVVAAAGIADPVWLAAAAAWMAGALAVLLYRYRTVET